MYELPQIGCIELITVRPTSGSPVKKLDHSMISVEQGLEGDYKTGKGGKRMVTLFQFEHLEVLSAILKKEVEPEHLRRNIFVSKINLLALSDKTFKIGDSIILKGTGFCVPCKKRRKI